MKSKKLNKLWVGLLFGLFGELVGFIIVFFMYTVTRDAYSGSSFGYFWNVYFLGNPSSQSAVLSLAMVFNAFIFFYLLNLGHSRAAMGIIGLGLLIAPYICYLKFFA